MHTLNLPLDTPLEALMWDTSEFSGIRRNRIFFRNHLDSAPIVSAQGINNAVGTAAQSSLQRIYPGAALADSPVFGNVSVGPCLRFITFHRPCQIKETWPSRSASHCKKR